MPAKVVLTAVGGPLRGQEYVFDGRGTCILGRDEDCFPRLPDDGPRPRVSRHHCLLDINPPAVRIRDFGSRNGTHVKSAGGPEVLIGRRPDGRPAAEGQRVPLPEHDLHDGDEFRILDHVFRVRAVVPVCCRQCGREAPEGAAPSYLCPACSEALPPTLAVPPTVGRCPRCGADVPGAAGAGAPGAFVCPACRDHPETVLRALLQEALAPAGPAPGLRGYEIVRELGAGGMGAVYLARAPDGSEVAVKVMLPRVAASPRAAATFLREAELARSLRHPHVVGLREAGCADGVFFLTMEYCHGGSVADLQRRRGGRLPWQEAVPLVLQALDGLAYAHAAPLALTQGGDRAEARGLVHRDVKPANLLLAGATGAWSVKVADFGLAKAFDLAGLSGQTLTGGVGGTPRFMPRQQVVNFKYARPEVDVWAAAACLYFLLTGCPPRDYARGRDPWQVTLQTDRVPVHRREHGRSLPRRLADLLDEALVDRPAIPFTTAAAFKAALEGAIG